jgi:uncharacterized protein (DUF983 family)
MSDYLLLDGYDWGAPTPEAESIDQEIAGGMKCPRCGGSCYYEGYHRPSSYIALAICLSCGHEEEF